MGVGTTRVARVIQVIASRGLHRRASCARTRWNLERTIQGRLNSLGITRIASHNERVKREGYALREKKGAETSDNTKSQSSSSFATHPPA